MMKPNFPKGKPNRMRLLSHPMICPLSKDMMLGCQCLNSGCEFAIEAEGAEFVDCTFLELTPEKRRQVRAVCPTCDRRRRKQTKEQPGQASPEKEAAGSRVSYAGDSP